MALRVNLGFGGFKPCTWGNLAAVVQTYNTIAEQYELIKPRGACILEFDNQTGDLTGVTFNYQKANLLESNLQAFNDQWQSITVQYDITRNQTYVLYFED